MTTNVNNTEQQIIPWASRQSAHRAGRKYGEVYEIKAACCKVGNVWINGYFIVTDFRVISKGGTYRIRDLNNAAKIALQASCGGREYLP